MCWCYNTEEKFLFFSARPTNWHLIILELTCCLQNGPFNGPQLLYETLHQQDHFWMPKKNEITKHLFCFFVYNCIKKSLKIKWIWFVLVQGFSKVRKQLCASSMKQYLMADSERKKSACEIKMLLRLSQRLLKHVHIVVHKVQSRFLWKQEVCFYLCCSEQLLEIDTQQLQAE